MDKRYVTDHGFTLIEAMVVLVILSIGILAVYTMQISSVRGNAMANKITTAATEDGGIIESVIGQAYDNMTVCVAYSGNQCIEFCALDMASPCEGQDPEGKYNFTVTLQDETPIRNLKTITVQVTDIEQKMSTPVTFTYIKYDLP